MEAASADRIADRVARAVESGLGVPPAGLRLLIRRFGATGREDFRLVLGPALTRALASERDEASAEGLIALVEALPLSDDAVLRRSVISHAEAQRRGWPGRGALLLAGQSVEACLAAGDALSDGDLVSDAVDELERIVAIGYEPGDGVSQTLRTALRQPGDLGTHAGVSLALLRAFDITGRLAYPMLAAELMHRWTSAPADGSMPTLDAARVLARLAQLQRDPDYRAAAVTRADARYDEAGRRFLHGFSQHPNPPLAIAAAYGLAIEEWLRLT